MTDQSHINIVRRILDRWGLEPIQKGELTRRIAGRIKAAELPGVIEHMIGEGELEAVWQDGQIDRRLVKSYRRCKIVPAEVNKRGPKPRGSKNEMLDAIRDLTEVMRVVASKMPEVQQ